jgi:uncharacterized protein (TIGR03437 family)
MRWNGFLITLAVAALANPGATTLAATFGTVVPIGGHASDIALDESRGVLYVANFTANRIEVMSTANNAIRSSMNVPSQPGSLTLSPDNQYLLVTHYGNFTAPAPSRNAITLINLADNTRQTFAMGDPPLGAAFIADGRAFIVTSTSLVLLEPATGAMSVVATFGSLAKSMPVDAATFPSQVIQATLATNADRTSVYGIADDGEFQAFYQFDLRKGEIFAIGIVASPRPLPRISVSNDGSWAMLGQYKVDRRANDLAQFPNSITSTNIGGAAVDSRAGLIYAEILTASLPNSPASSSSSTPVATTAISGPPVLHVLDADNLTVRESLRMPEHITGRSVLSSAADVIYAVSDSGVMVFPVGRLNQQHRVIAGQSDVMVSGNFCNRNVLIQKLTITDPGGGNTDFQIGSNLAGVTVSPSSGMTPATVQVRVDPSAFQDQTGTVVGQLTISSASAVNLPSAVRVLVNNRNPDQRGTVVNVPGTLTDILGDPLRNRFYVVRQDKNQILVFDASTYTQIATLRTSTTPTQMALTFDRKYLVVGHDNSQQAFVFDLDTLKTDAPIFFPPGHYPRSIAESGKAMLALVRNVAEGGPGEIDRIDMVNRVATELPSLGVYSNKVDPAGVLTPAPNGGNILAVMPDGNVMLYDANADTFTISRKDFETLAGSYAASSYNTYVAGQHLLNASLVPQAEMEVASGQSAGFAFVDQWGLRTTAPAAGSPGIIQHVDPAQSLSIKPTRMVEAPLSGSTDVPLLRSLAPLYDRSAVVSLTVSGITVLPWAYDAAVAMPRIQSVVNAADGKLAVAPGGLITVYGDQMSPVNIATKQIPLPTALGESCLTVNGVPVPMLFVSSKQINGQLPFNVDGNATMTLRTPGGISDNFYFSILPGAPSIFRTGTAGPDTSIATIIRATNDQLVTPSNPIHVDDTIVIYLTGLGRTSPAVESGVPAPSDPLPSAIITPSVTLGGMGLNVLYAGLVPGEVGLYQINASVPFGVPQGFEVPLVISQGGTSTSLNVRVVK